MKQTSSFFCTCGSSVADCQSQSELQGQVSLAIVNHILCLSGGYEQFIKGLLLNCKIELSSDKSIFMCFDAT